MSFLKFLPSASSLTPVCFPAQAGTVKCCGFWGGLMVQSLSERSEGSGSLQESSSPVLMKKISH